MTYRSHRQYGQITVKLCFVLINVSTIQCRASNNLQFGGELPAANDEFIKSCRQAISIDNERPQIDPNPMGSFAI